MGILFVSLIAVLSVEYFLRLPFALRCRALMVIATKSVRRILSKKISDHWKEVILLRYARELMTHTFVIASMLIAWIPLVVLPALFLDWIFVPHPSTIESFSNLSGMASMTVVSFIYILLRKRLGTI
jgi:hypothetical protein